MQLRDTRREDVTKKFKGRSHFSVKLEPNLSRHPPSAEEGRNYWVFLHSAQNKVGSPLDEIVNGREFHEEVTAIVKEKGVLKTFGHFYAFYTPEQGLMINIKRIQPPTADDD